MRSISKIAFALFLLAAIPCAHADDLCQQNLDIAINVTPIYEDPRYDHNASIAQIQNMSRDAAHVIPEAITLGLTHYQQQMSVKPVSIIRSRSDGPTCAQIKQVDIEFGYRDLVVYIAREIPEGTCGFDRVMTHEQRHVAVQRQILADFIPRLQQNLKESLADSGTIRARTYDEAVTWERDRMQTIAQNIITDIANENQRLQSGIDTVEEYTEISNSCNGELGHILGEFVRRGR